MKRQKDQALFLYVALAGLELYVEQAGLELTEILLPLPLECYLLQTQPPISKAELQFLRAHRT